MIITSIGLVLLAVALLALGVGQGSEPLYYASIVSSALAAAALIVGVRRRAPAAAAPVPGVEPAVGRVTPRDTNRMRAYGAVYGDAPGSGPEPG